MATIAKTIQMTLEEAASLQRIKGDQAVAIFTPGSIPDAGEVAAVKLQSGRVLHIQRGEKSLAWMVDRSNGYAWSNIKPPLPILDANVRLIGQGAGQETAWEMALEGPRTSLLLLIAVDALDVHHIFFP
ncbi:MAG TPA: hypothetical protein PKM21_15995 [Anaerolineales bacterium]|nr:hypothetical protein [Anaerolineales bacterium]